MKKFFAAFIIVSLLITALWWMARRRPAGPPPEGTISSFKAERSGKGILLQYQDAQLPLRSIRWVNPRFGGIQIAQVITQSNRQQIAWFEQGVLQGSYIIPKPHGVRDGFFRFAELQDAVLCPGDAAVLLYRASDPASEELPLVVALDLNTQEIRWIHRAKGLRLIPTPELMDGAVYLFGPRDPIVRLPIAVQMTEQPSHSEFRSIAKSIELPIEIQEMGDLLPLGTYTFLVAHRNGLSTYLGVKGWTHQTLPELPAVSFQNAPPRLVRGKALWWQPQPGLLIQLHGDGTRGQIWSPDELITSDPFGKDRALLRLLGADALGRLWFDLATPVAPQIPATPSPTPEQPSADSVAAQTQEEGQPTPIPEVLVADPSTELIAYASQGLDRLYLWNPEDRILKRLSWKEAIAPLQSPSGLAIPIELPGIHPESDGILFQTGPSAWWLPLDVLPFGSPSITLKPQ